jgi:hypothetical protein
MKLTTFALSTLLMVSPFANAASNVSPTCSDLMKIVDSRNNDLIMSTIVNAVSEIKNTNNQVKVMRRMTIHSESYAVSLYLYCYENKSRKVSRALIDTVDK